VRTEAFAILAIFCTEFSDLGKQATDGEEFFTPGNRVDLQGQVTSQQPIGMSGRWHYRSDAAACEIEFIPTGALTPQGCNTPLSSAHRWRLESGREGTQLVLVGESGAVVWRALRGADGVYTGVGLRGADATLSPANDER